MSDSIKTDSGGAGLPAALPSSRRLQVRHDTAYRYQVAAGLGYSLAWLAPREVPGQRVLEHRLTVWPKPRFIDESLDSFGNTRHYFEVHKPHSELRIQSHAVVERAPAPDVGLLTQPWESARPLPALQGVGTLPPWEFIYPTALTPLHPDYSAYALEAFTPGRPLGAALLAFNHQIHSDFAYVPGVTEVDTPLTEVWESRAGVCQDFAHIALAALRGIGLAVAYVSGYLLTFPPAGTTKRLGADQSHAWFAVWTGADWLHLDPTNDLVVGSEHIVVAMARDYADSPPVKGVCFGGGQHQLSVAVTVNDLALVSAPAEAAPVVLALPVQMPSLATQVQSMKQEQTGEDIVDGN